MKKIDSITIRYFRSVYTLNIGQCEDITIVSGRNDVGKSNILKALNLFFCQQSDYLHNFDFVEDYSNIRRDEVKKDTIRGQQFISISIRFLRGNRMENSLPPSFSVTKRWDMHSSECKMTSDVLARMEQFSKKHGKKFSEKTTNTSLSTFLNRIRYIYVPAIKDEQVFKETLNLLQESLFSSKNKKILDTPINEANHAVQNVIGELQKDFEDATGIKNFVELPNTLNYTHGLLQVNTQTSNGLISIDKRGDGIKAHYIPKILNYVAKHSKNIFIWGFEEPENSYEYCRCMQVAKEFDEVYCQNCQVFITTHSPAFFEERDNKKIVLVGNKDGKTILMDENTPIDEELGYIALYRGFLEKLKAMQDISESKEKEISDLRSTIQTLSKPMILTEGKTDAQLLKQAAFKLGLTEFQAYDIQPIISDGTSNNTVLLKFLHSLRDNVQSNQVIIGMFDRDTPLLTEINGSRVDIRNEKFVKIGKNIFAFSIPVPHARAESNQISIEHYFTDEEIKTELEGKRLFIGNEFYKTGVCKSNPSLYYKSGARVADTIKIIEHESNNYVMNADGTGDYSISKSAFVNAICEEKDSFKGFSFDEFQKIFDVINSIVSSSKE